MMNVAFPYSECGQATSAGELSRARALEAACSAQARLLRGEPETEVLSTLLRTAAEMTGAYAARLRVRGTSIHYVSEGSEHHSFESTSDAAVLLSVGDDNELSLWPEPAGDEWHEALRPVVDAAGQILAAVRQRRVVEERLRKQREALRAMNEIAAFPEIEARMQFVRALALGARFLGLPVAAISRIDDGVCTIMVHEAPVGPSFEGLSMPIEETYCAVTLEARDVLSVPRVAGSRLASAPCHGSLNLQAYIAAPIRIGGRPYGTVWFAANTPRVEEFDDADEEFVRLLARWVGGVVSRAESIEQVARSEAHHRSVIASLAEGIVVQNASGRIVSWNGSALRVLGLTAEEISGADSIDPRWRAIREDGSPFPGPEHPAMHTLATGEPLSDVVMGIEHRSGQRSWISINTQPIFESGSTAPVAVVASFFDISALKLGAEEQREAAARIRGIVDTVPDAIVTIDGSGRIDTFNPAAERTFGWSAAEVVGKSVRSLIGERWGNEGDRTSLLPEDWICKVDRSTGRDWVGKRKEGTLFPIEVSISEMGFNGKRMFTGVIRDVTERKRVEDALQLASAKSQSLLDAIPDLMLQLDEGGRFVDYQAQNADLLMQPHVFMGRVLEEVLDPEVSARTRTAMNDVRLRGGAQVFEYALGGQDWEARVAGVATGGFLIIIRNITERKRMERLKSEFVSTVSHELRTPLTSIRGSLGLVISGRMGEMTDKAKNLLTIAHKNSERLSNLINDILDIEKIESGRMRFDLEKHEVDVLVEQAVEANRGYGQPLDVTFAITERTRGLWAMVDHDRFLQVMANLLSNAAKFSPRGGVVKVAVESSYDVVRVSVTDSGPGIPEGFRPRVFERFTQADASDARKLGGTGLGLSIAKVIVDKMGGRIGFETETGVGTTFFFSIPLIRPVEETTAAAAAASCFRILVADQDGERAHRTRNILDEVGLESVHAASVNDAVAALDRMAFGAVVLSLPERDSAELVQHLKRGGDSTNVPVVMLGVECESCTAEEGTTVVDCLGLPLDRERLLRVMRRCYDQGDGERVRILHVEDDDDLCAVVATLLSEVAHCERAATLQEARQRLATGRYDLMILDLELPDGVGWDLIAGTKAPFPVLVFSGRPVRSEDAAHADATLVKSSTSNDELLRTIDTLVADKRLPRERAEGTLP